MLSSEQHSRSSNNEEHGIVQRIKEGFFENVTNEQRSERLKILGEGAEGTVWQVLCKELVAGRKKECQCDLNRKNPIQSLFVLAGCPISVVLPYLLQLHTLVICTPHFSHDVILL